MMMYRIIKLSQIGMISKNKINELDSIVAYSFPLFYKKSGIHLEKEEIARFVFDLISFFLEKDRRSVFKGND